MTDLDLDAIEARANAATDGPWVVKHEPAWEADNVQHPDVITVGAQMWEADDEPMTVCLVSTDHEDDPVDVLLDAEFIAHARTDVPALVAALREARAEVAEWRRVMARPHPGDPCWETHGIEHQDSCACCERDEARAEAARWHDDYLATHKEKRELTTIVVQQRAERDDWRRRYEALRDGVTGLHFRDARGGCASCIDPDGFSVRWPCETAAVVARVEGDES